MRVLGIDIGGTFTDLVLLDSERGDLHTHKLLTTPEDPVKAVLVGAETLLKQAGSRLPSRIVHGTTLVTNAVVERKGAKTALLTTKGFRDVLEIRREGRYDLYDLDLEFPEPLVPRRRRLEVEERLDEHGTVLQNLNEHALVQLLKTEESESIESWAVCFLHAYTNADHENQARRILENRYPDLPLSLSSEVAPEIREYERTSTTVANAYVRPIAEGYLHRLRDGLQKLVPREHVLHIMLSDGGITTPETAARFPIRIVESGPAGGVLAAERLGRGLNAPALLSLDMGGTTAKIAFLDAGGPRTRSHFEVDRRHLYKRGSGIPLLVPALDLVEIGAGGGSLAAPTTLGTLRVGPESAGADPGPACYARGGTRATVTDADLVLGLLNPDYFLGGAMALDREAARSALEQDVARPLSLSPEEAAMGVHTLVGSNMAEAARVHAAERGVDLSEHTLVAFGGAGPVHAWSMARQLRMSRILFPGHAGVESALGFLAAGPAFEVARSRTEALDTLEESDVRALLHSLAREGETVVTRAGSGAVQVAVSVDMRYRGQGAEVRVPLRTMEVTRAGLHAAFAKTYRNAYGREVTGVPIETVTWRVRCTQPPPPIPVLDGAGETVSETSPPAPVAAHHAWIPDLDQPAEVPVYRRDRLQPGTRFPGPCLVEESQCTLVVGRGHARVLPGGTVLAEVEP